MATEQHDLVIVGAGVSGIGAACHLVRRCPGKGFVLLERRADLGGTWDLFRFPGIRSDSDMATYGYGFRPWMEPRTMADGASIRAYLRETAAEHGVVERIRFRRRLVRAAWSSGEERWNLTVRHEESGEDERLACRFLVACTGYFDHDGGHRPELPGESRFRGRIVHPQRWPAELDVSGRRVVVIGSGATAVTLVPELARRAAHVTMLQRSPSDVLSLPAADAISKALERVLPKRAVYRLARRRNIALQVASYRAARRWPRLVRGLLRLAIRRHLGRGFDLGHFTPAYPPWDQRLCVVPDGDLFAALRDGRASVVTERIDTFTEGGIRLASGRELAADLVVAATGFEVRMLGGASLEVDGEEVPIAERLTYKGVLLEGVPNAAVFLGYVNASWTLKVDLAGAWLCRLLAHMDEHGYTRVVAEGGERCATDATILDALSSGYVRRAARALPRQGRRDPWRVTHDYRHDRRMLCREPIADGVLRFAPKPGAVADSTAAI